MELRNHPLMSYLGLCSWPPIWVKLSGLGETIRGEVGVLETVVPSKVTLTHCYLTIEYQAEHYMGTLLFDDRRFCRDICNILSKHIGISIKDIGDLDLSFTL